MLDASTAPAAPVAPHAAPKIPASGTRTSISTPCVQMRRFGRPIETGNDFVQPKIIRNPPATITRRVASTAPRFLAENNSRAISGVKTRSGGGATPGNPPPAAAERRKPAQDTTPVPPAPAPV